MRIAARGQAVWYAPPVQLWMEVEGLAGRVEAPSGGGQLVAFMSFAVMRGFGAQHPLIALADRLHDVHKVRFGPLTTFYEAEAEDAEDREKLEMAWQEAGPLAASIEAIRSAIPGDEQALALLKRAGADSLVEQAEGLLPALQDAEAAGRRVRLVYAL